MPNPLIRSLITSAVYYGVGETLLKGEQSRRAIRSVVLGILLFLIAASMWLVALVLFVLGIFFQLSGQTDLVPASFISAGIAFLIAIALLVEGIRLISKKK